MITKNNNNYNMILYNDLTITNNGQDFYHDTGWQKVN